MGGRRGNRKISVLYRKLKGKLSGEMHSVKDLLLIIKIEISKNVRK